MVPEEKRLAVSHLYSEHLVEIAIIDFASPADAQRRAAHETLHSHRIKTVGQQVQVFGPITALAETFGETCDWLIRDREQARELNAVSPAQFSLVVRFQLGLRRRQ